MMKKIIILLLLPAFFGCKNSGNAANNGLDTASIDKLAGHMCRAISIRRQRFSLANSIRFAQDTLATAKTAADRTRLQTRLDSCMKRKVFLLHESLALADTIHKQMDSIVPYTDKAKERSFNAYLNNVLAKKGYTGG